MIRSPHPFFFFSRQVVSYFSTKLKENLILLSAGQSLKIIFDDRSPCEFWLEVLTEFKEFYDIFMKTIFSIPVSLFYEHFY